MVGAMAPKAKPTATAGTTGIHRAPGRPRRPGVEDAVLGAALELLSERGIEGTTMNAVVERSGVARATVYLRWPNRQALITAAVRHSMGPPVLTVSGHVEHDLRTAAARIQEVLAAPAFRSVFPAVVAGLTRGEPSETQVSFEAIAPGRKRVVAAYAEFAKAQGFRTDISPDLAVDLIIGASIGHYLATGTPPTDDVRDQITEIVFDGLRVRPKA